MTVTEPYFYDHAENRKQTLQTIHTGSYLYIFLRRLHSVMCCIYSFTFVIIIIFIYICTVYVLYICVLCMYYI